MAEEFREVEKFGEAAGPLEVRIDAAQGAAQAIQVGELLRLEELRLDAREIHFRAGAPLVIEQVNATATVAESALNRLLAGQSTDHVKDLQVALLNGRARISGRYTRLLVSLPFTFTAVPEIEGGARLRLDPRQISFVGASLPAAIAQIIGERINTRLAEAFDATRLSLPLRLTGLTVETGRLVLTASARLELHPPRS